MANGIQRRKIFTDRSVSYVLIQAPPNAKGFEKAEVTPYDTHLTTGPRIRNHTRTISRLELLPRPHCEKSPNSYPRVHLCNLLPKCRLLIPAKDIPPLFATTARASVKKSFAGKNNAMSAFLTAGAKSVAKCIICNNKTAPGKKLCSDHDYLESVVAAEKQAAMEKLGGESNMLGSACRSCQGSVVREVLCTNLYIPSDDED